MAQQGGDAETEENRKKRIGRIMQALKLALSKVDAKTKKTNEINTARTLLAFFALESGDHQQAIEVGEGFARQDPRSTQAGNAAAYALRAYLQIIGEKERKMAAADESSATATRCCPWRAT